MLDPSMQYRFESVLRCGGNDRRVFVLASWQATEGLQARLPKLRLAGKSVISHRVLDAPAGEQGFNGTSLTRQFGIVVIVLRGPHEPSIHMTERLRRGPFPLQLCGHLPIIKHLDRMRPPTQPNPFLISRRRLGPGLLFGFACCLAYSSLISVKSISATRTH